MRPTKITSVAVGCLVLASMSIHAQSPLAVAAPTPAYATAPANPPVVTARTVGAVFFHTDSAEIDQSLWPVLLNVIETAKAHPSLSIQLDAHADVRGSRTYNHTLSARRAENVANFLVAHGIAREQIDIRLFGERRASINVKDVNRQLYDRRVTITLRDSPVSA